MREGRPRNDLFPQPILKLLLQRRLALQQLYSDAVARSAHRRHRKADQPGQKDQRNPPAFKSREQKRD